MIVTAWILLVVFGLMAFMYLLNFLFGEMNFLKMIFMILFIIISSISAGIIIRGVIPVKLEQYMVERRRTAGEHETPTNELLNLTLGLCGETGEIADQVKKMVYHNHPVYDSIKKIEKEIGDVCWYLFGLIDSMGLDFETILENNIEKLRKRYPEGFSSEKSINRGE